MVRPPYDLWSGGCKLAPRKIKIRGLRLIRVRFHKKTVLRVGKCQVVQRKFKCRRRHFILGNHNISGLLYDFPQIQSMRTYGGTLPAETAGIYHFVCVSCAHGNSQIVVYFPEIFLRPGFVAAHKSAGVYTVCAGALQAA